MPIAWIFFAGNNLFYGKALSVNPLKFGIPDSDLNDIHHPMLHSFDRIVKLFLHQPAQKNAIQRGLEDFGKWLYQVTW